MSQTLCLENIGKVRHGAVEMMVNEALTAGVEPAAVIAGSRD